MFVFLLLTNRYLSFDQGVDYFMASDTLSYMRIAMDAPSLTQHLQGYFHHDQRFVFPYLIGCLSKVLHINEYAVFILAILSIAVLLVYLLNKILITFKLSEPQLLLCNALFIFSPYTLRYYLSVPAMVIDLFFVLGLMVFICGLVEKNKTNILIGQVISILSRQTAVLVLPMGLIWVWINMKKESLLKKITFSGLLTLITILGYFLTSQVTKNIFQDVNHNLDSLVGFFSWSKEHFNYKVLIEFLVRGVTPFFFIFGSLLPLINKKKLVIPQEAVFLLLIAFFVCIQPFLGGPDYTGQNIIRLNTLAMAPLVVMIALLMKKNNLLQKYHQPYFLLALLCVIAGSFHHMSFIWGAGLGRTSIFFAIFLSAAVLYSVIFYKLARKS
jgi:hypothetical protein